MNLMKLVRNAAMVVMLASAGLANATVLQFTLTGDYSAQWKLDSAVTPAIDSEGEGFTLFDVEGFPDAVFELADLTFYNAAIGGGLSIYDYYGDVNLLSTDGPQLYSGLESEPIFILGTFALTEFQGSGTYTLTIAEADVAAAVPEPATGLLLLGGLALIGGMRARRAKQ